MKRRNESFKWLLLVLMACVIMAIALPGCGQGQTTPAWETQTSEVQAGDYQMAEADELRLELGELLNTAKDTGIEVADYCDTFWETWRDGTEEEMLQLAEDHPRMVTKVDDAVAELNYVPTLINKTKDLNIPDWYRDYFSKKEQAAGYLNIAFQQAETFLTGVESMIRDMSDFISVGEGILEFWAEIMPEIDSLIDTERYDEARDMVYTWTSSVDDMQYLLGSAYQQSKVPVLQWFIDRCSSIERMLLLLDDWLVAKEAGNDAQVEQVRNEILDLAHEELDILKIIPWDESNSWFNSLYGAYIDEARDGLSQAMSLNGEAELAYEAHWVPSTGGAIFDIAQTTATNDVYEQVLVETEDYTYWDSGDIAAGHSAIDIVSSHTREDGGNIVFWMEVVGPITDDTDFHYNFTVFAGTWEERILNLYYSNGEAEYSLPEGSWETFPCEYYISDTAIMILVSKDIVGTPAAWMVSVTAYEYRDIVWDETGTKILSGEYYQDNVLLKVEE